MKSALIAAALFVTGLGSLASAMPSDLQPITIRTESFPRPPYSGATYYIYEQEGRLRYASPRFGEGLPDGVLGRVSFWNGARSNVIGLSKPKLVQGEQLNPDLMLTLSRPQFNGKRLIHLRENFLSELRADSKTVRRKN